MKNRFFSRSILILDQRTRCNAFACWNHYSRLTYKFYNMSGTSLSLLQLHRPFTLWNR